jgi:hypothetical protein
MSFENSLAAVAIAAISNTFCKTNTSTTHNNNNNNNQKTTTKHTLSVGLVGVSNHNSFVSFLNVFLIASRSVMSIMSMSNPRFGFATYVVNAMREREREREMIIIPD